MIDLNDFDALRISKGDVLVLRPKSPLSMEQMARLSEQLKGTFEKLGVAFIVIDSGLDVEAVQSNVPHVNLASVTFDATRRTSPEPINLTAPKYPDFLPVIRGTQ